MQRKQLQFDTNMLKSSTARDMPVNIKSEDKEFDKVDPLVFLEDTKERKEINGMQERINLLKTELNSLLVDLKTDKNSDYFTDECNLFSNTPLHPNIKDLENDIKPVENLGLFKETSINKNKFKPNFNSTPSKFSEWLDNTVDKLERKSETEKSKKSELLLNSVLQMDLTPETFLTNSFPNEVNSSNMFLSQQKVEQLLYKSFLMQNSSVCLPTSQASGLKQHKSAKKRKHLSCRSRSAKKFNQRGPVQGNVWGSFSQCQVKQRKFNSRNSPSEVEIITLDSSSGSNKLSRVSVECVDLDVSSYDWSEPFVINESIDHSDIQEIEDGGEKNVINYKELTSNNSELLESDFSICGENDKLQPKKVWECPVCFERSKGQEVVATQCGHVFCKKCIERHISNFNNCPSCRCDLKDKPIITLFNF